MQGRSMRYPPYRMPDIRLRPTPQVMNERQLSSRSVGQRKASNRPRSIGRVPIGVHATSKRRVTTDMNDSLAWKE